MRDVETRTVYPFLSCVDAKGANCESLNGEYFLHGNRIAQKLGNGLILHNAGWNSRTTGSRLRAIVAAFGRPYVYVSQKDGSLGIEIDGIRLEFDNGPVFLASYTSHPNDRKVSPFVDLESAMGLRVREAAQ